MDQEKIVSVNLDTQFRNPNLSLDIRLEDMISRLTLDEKAGLVSSSQKGIDRLGISEWHVGCEVARGYVGRSEKEPSTVLPQPIGMASMFDPDLMYQLGELAGNEARVYYQKDKKGKLMLWGPTVDMERDPRWGRTEEAYGEDPYLTGQMTIAYTKGLKGEDKFYLRTVPTLKHFCANNNEKDRGSCSANLEPRTKHEYYYQAFRPSITEGGALSMMAAYNELSGVPAILNPDLKSIVKEQWGLKFVVSDGADFSQNVTEHNYVNTHAESLALAIHAGCDIMTDDTELVQASVLEALKKGLLTESELDESIKRVMAMRFRLGEFDPEEMNPYANIPESIINCDVYKDLNNKAAKEQVILLKNEDILPLNKDNVKKVAVLGPIADKNYKDWYTGFSDYNISVLAGLIEEIGEKRVLYDNAYDRVALKSKATGKYLSVKDDESIVADACQIEEGETFEYHDWGFNSQNLLSMKNQKFLREDNDIKASGEDTFAWFVKEWVKCKEYQDNQPKDNQENGCQTKYNQANGNQTEDNITEENLTKDNLTKAKMNEVKMSEVMMTMDTWNDYQITTDKDGKLTTCQKTRMTEGKQFTKEVISDGIARAVALAKESDVAIVCVGNDPLQVARECYDRPDIILPKHQTDLIQAVYAANPNTIVIIISSYPYAVRWEKENIPAMIYTSHAGPELGHAITDVLFGRYNPAGRTPLTWYNSIDELPNIMDYDIIKNNATYLYYDGEPLYPFGYGLSYSNYVYTNLKIEKLSVFEQDNEEQLRLRISLEVENTSKVDGDEVIQLYFKANNLRVKRPLRQLCAFKRIHIKTNEKINIVFELKESALEFFDVTRDRFCVEAGEYTFMVGASSEDIRLKKTLYIEGETIPAQTLHKTTSAINYDDKSGIRMNFSKEKNKHYISTHGMEKKFIKYGEVDLTGNSLIEVVVATSVGKAILEIYVDTTEGEPIGKIEVPVTGGREQFIICKGVLNSIEGIHDLYLVPVNDLSLLSLKLI